MKRILVIFIVFCIVLTGCGANEQQEIVTESESIDSQPTQSEMPVETIDPNAVITVISGGESLAVPTFLTWTGDMEPTVPADRFFDDAPIVEYHDDFHIRLNDQVIDWSYSLLDPPDFYGNDFENLKLLPEGVYRINFRINTNEPEEHNYFAAIRLKVNGEKNTAPFLLISNGEKFYPDTINVYSKKFGTEGMNYHEALRLLSKTAPTVTFESDFSFILQPECRYNGAYIYDNELNSLEDLHEYYFWRSDLMELPVGDYYIAICYYDNHDRNRYMTVIKLNKTIALEEFERRMFS